jgi:hypothetical protein
MFERQPPTGQDNRALHTAHPRHTAEEAKDPARATGMDHIVWGGMMAARWGENYASFWRWSLNRQFGSVQTQLLCPQFVTRC